MAVPAGEITSTSTGTMHSAHLVGVLMGALSTESVVQLGGFYRNEHYLLAGTITTGLTVDSPSVMDLLDSILTTSF